MTQQLVVNGCSYTHSYASGNGHQDLAQRLGIATAHSIAEVVAPIVEYFELLSNIVTQHHQPCMC